MQPFFWQTLWFRVVVWALAIGLSASGVWWFTRSKALRQIAELERARKEQAELARLSRLLQLGELSASLAHELNQPLAAILSNTQAAMRFLNNDPADVDEVRASHQDIADSDRRASEIIRRMIAMMKKGEAHGSRGGHRT